MDIAILAGATFLIGGVIGAWLGWACRDAKAEQDKMMNRFLLSCLEIANSTEAYRLSEIIEYTPIKMEGHSQR